MVIPELTDALTSMKNLSTRISGRMVFSSVTVMYSCTAPCRREGGTQLNDHLLCVYFARLKAYWPQRSSKVERIWYISLWIKLPKVELSIIVCYHSSPKSPQGAVVVIIGHSSRWTQAEDKTIVTGISAVEITAYINGGPPRRIAELEQMNLQHIVCMHWCLHERTWCRDSN